MEHVSPCIHGSGHQIMWWNLSSNHKGNSERSFTNNKHMGFHQRLNALASFLFVTSYIASQGFPHWGGGGPVHSTTSYKGQSEPSLHSQKHPSWIYSHALRILPCWIHGFTLTHLTDFTWWNILKKQAWTVILMPNILH